MPKPQSQFFCLFHLLQTSHPWCPTFTWTAYSKSHLACNQSIQDRRDPIWERLYPQGLFIISEKMPSSFLLHLSETKSNLPGRPAPPGHAWLAARSLPPASDDHQEAGIGLPWRGLPPVLLPAQWQDGASILQWSPASVVPAVSLKGILDCLNFSTHSVSQSESLTLRG